MVSKILVMYTTGDHDIVDTLWDIEGVDEVTSIAPLSDWGECPRCIHWNGPRWGCESALSMCPPNVEDGMALKGKGTLPDWMEGEIPDWVLRPL